MAVTAVESRFSEEEETFVGQTRRFTKLGAMDFEILFFVHRTIGKPNNNEYS